MKDERREERKKLQALSIYLKMSQEAILELQANEIISSREWFRYYGLYCSGKDIQADTRVLGQELLNKTQSLKMTLVHGIDLIDMSSEEIAADLSQEISLEETPSRHM